MKESLHYSLLIAWSDDDDVFIVRLPEWGDRVHTHGATYEEAVQRGKELIEGLIAVRRQHGEPLPKPQVFSAA